MLCKHVIKTSLLTHIKYNHLKFQFVKCIKKYKSKQKVKIHQKNKHNIENVKLIF